VFFGSRLLTFAAGAILLLAGRKVYWFLVGLVGFVLGYGLAAEFVPGPSWLILIAGLVAGLVASGLAVFFQRIVLTVAGLLIGGLAVLWWAEQMHWGTPWWVWALAVGAGLIGAVLTRQVFEVALMVLSSVFGATLVLEALHLSSEQLSPVFFVLVAAGILIQFFGSRRQGSS
jgi:hypothetical protein